MDRLEAVGPKVGGELRQKALIAILLSFVATLVYLAFRFEFRFGVAAVAATAHDILTTLAFIKYMNLEVSLVVVGAILTVVGYSLNDTIIIFDRTRENLHKYKRDDLGGILNRSINETLPRSVLTHGTTIVTTMALLVFAGEVIRPFAWVMTFGIFTGTFSSIYIAGPILLWIEQKWPGKEARGVKAHVAPASHRAALAPHGGVLTGAAATGPGRVTAPGLVDSHCHLADPAFDADREVVLSRARAAGVVAVVVVADGVDSAERCAALAARPGLFATAGVHPHRASEFDAGGGATASTPCCGTRGWWRWARRGSTTITTTRRASASGRRSPGTWRGRRRRASRWWCTRARRTRTRPGSSPRRPDGLTGVLHCFSAGPAVLEAALARGLAVSWSGMVTFRNFRGGWALERVPDDALLVETDAPYLAPVPHRGGRNEPAYVARTAARLAELRGTTAEHIAAVTTANARRLFHLTDDTLGEGDVTMTDLHGRRDAARRRRPSGPTARRSSPTASSTPRGRWRSTPRR